MASFPVTTYGDWAVTKTLKEGEVVLGDGEKPRDGKLWVTVTKKDSSSTHSTLEPDNLFTLTLFLSSISFSE